MPIALQTRINLLDTEMQLFWNDMHLLYQHTSNLATYLALEGNPNSGTAASGMANDIFYLRDHWGTASTSIMGLFNWILWYINDNAFNGVGGDVTMPAILSAMLSATFNELQQFMGITDAYKVAIWDAPYNEEFYAALGRGFKVWGA